jgi:small subunit ribosomal protein S3Ae
MAKSVLRKTWYEIVAPDVFDNETVADTPAEEAEMVDGRQVKVNLKDLMPTSDKYYMDVFLQVQDVEGEKARTELAGHTTSSEYISKMISRRSNRLDWVGDAETADGKEVRVKVVATTIRKTQSAQVSRLRKRVGELVEDAAADMKFDAFMEAVFQDEIQQHIKDDVKEIYPLRDLEIRKTEVK